ncbi:MAG: DUF5056 domain-containing protein [Bacteroidetes bacterium]|nr:DUF5056 domain-containing protein [Bacteroidota bacterium]
MHEHDLKKLFDPLKTAIPDQGFSEEVVQRLPKRKNLLPQIVLIVFILLGLILTIGIQGVTNIHEQIVGLSKSIGQMQAPSSIAIITYLGLFLWTVTTGYALTRAVEG